MGHPEMPARILRYKAPKDPKETCLAFRLRASSALEAASPSEAETASLRKLLEHYTLERDDRDADARDSRNLLEALRKRTGEPDRRLFWYTLF